MKQTDFPYHTKIRCNKSPAMLNKYSAEASHSMKAESNATKKKHEFWSTLLSNVWYIQQNYSSFTW